jgi:hypothetical protein
LIRTSLRFHKSHAQVVVRLLHPPLPHL